MSYLFSLLVSVSNLGVLGTFVPDGRSFYLEKIKEKLDVRPWRINSDQGTSSDTKHKIEKDAKRIQKFIIGCF